MSLLNLINVVTLCLEQVSLEAHLLTGVKPKSCLVCVNGTRLNKSCVMQTRGSFTQMHPVFVQLHSKPDIESKPREKWNQGMVTYFSGNNNKKSPPLYLSLFRSVSVFLNYFVFCMLLTSCSLNSIFCFPLVSPRSCFSIYSQEGTVFAQRWKLQNYMNWFC